MILIKFLLFPCFMCVFVWVVFRVYFFPDFVNVYLSSGWCVFLSMLRCSTFSVVRHGAMKISKKISNLSAKSSVSVCKIWGKPVKISFYHHFCVVSFMCGIIHVWYRLCVVLFMCGIIYVWHHLWVVLFMCGIIYLWYRLCVVSFMCGIIYVWYHLHVVSFMCGNFYVWHNLCVVWFMYYFCVI